MPSFEDYKKYCGNFFTQKKVEKLTDFADFLLSSAQTADDKMNLITAMEFWHYDFVKQQVAIKALQNKLAVIKRVEKFTDFSHLTDDEILSLVGYQLMIKEKINELRNNPKRDKDLYEKLRVLSDYCLILITLYKRKPQGVESSKSVSALINEDDIFKACNQALYQPLGGVTLKIIFTSIKDSTKKVQDVKELKQDIEELEKKLILAQSRYNELKAAFKKKLQIDTVSSWKHRLLYQKQLKLIKLRGAKGVILDRDIAFDKRCTSERFFVEKSESKVASASIGNTYFDSTDKAGKHKNLILDANYGCYSETENDTGATSDGYGHLPDVDSNRQIQLAAFWTAKKAFQRIHTYQDPNKLFADMRLILEKVGNDLRNIGVKVDEFSGASCVITKVFKSSPGKITVFCGAIGDSVALAWTGSELLQLNKPRNYPRLMGQFTPIAVTEKFTDEQIDRCINELPSSSIILRMTDGIWQMLPHERVAVLKADNKTIAYFEFRLDAKKLTELFLNFSVGHSKATADDYRQWLQDAVIDEVNKRKTFLLELQRQMKSKGANINIKESLQKILDDAHEKNDELKNNVLLAFSHLELENNLEKVSLEHFLHKLENIQIGDDATLAVQQVSMRL